jgi:hypothetical protein
VGGGIKRKKERKKERKKNEKKKSSLRHGIPFLLGKIKKSYNPSAATGFGRGCKAMGADADDVFPTPARFPENFQSIAPLARSLNEFRRCRFSPKDKSPRKGKIEPAEATFPSFQSMSIKFGPASARNTTVRVTFERPYVPMLGFSLWKVR